MLKDENDPPRRKKFVRRINWLWGEGDGPSFIHQTLTELTKTETFTWWDADKREDPEKTSKEEGNRWTRHLESLKGLNDTVGYQLHQEKRKKFHIFWVKAKRMEKKTRKSTGETLKVGGQKGMAVQRTSEKRSMPVVGEKYIMGKKGKNLQNNGQAGPKNNSLKK